MAQRKSIGKRAVPGSNFYPAKVIKVYDEERFEKLFNRKRKILLHHPSEEGQVLIPLKNPLTSERADRNLQTPEGKRPVIVFKGAGTNAYPPFVYNPKDAQLTRRFWGGATAKELKHAADAALDLHSEYAKALSEGDPVVKAASEYGITEAPTLKPIALFKPLATFNMAYTNEANKVVSVKDFFNDFQATEERINFLRKNSRKLLMMKDPNALFKQAVPKFPKKLAAQQAVLAYEIDTMERIDPEYRSKASIRDRALIGVRLALARHLAERLNHTFSSSDLSSLHPRNVTVTGNVLDLDTVSYPLTNHDFNSDNNAAIETIGALRNNPFHVRKNKAMKAFTRISKLSRLFFSKGKESVAETLNLKPLSFTEKDLRLLEKDDSEEIRNLALTYRLRLYPDSFSAQYLSHKLKSTNPLMRFSSLSAQLQTGKLSTEEDLRWYGISAKGLRFSPTEAETGIVRLSLNCLNLKTSISPLTVDTITVKILDNPDNINQGLEKTACQVISKGGLLGARLLVRVGLDKLHSRPGRALNVAEALNTPNPSPELILTVKTELELLESNGDIKEEDKKEFMKSCNLFKDKTE